MATNYTFADLRSHGGTFRTTAKGTARERVHTPHSGVMTNAGEFEEAEWRRLVEELIAREGETSLQSNLREWTKEHCKWLQSKEEISRYALELHAARIFDDPCWVGFIPFNRKYRPTAMEGVEVVSLITICCRTPGQVTRAHYDSNAGRSYDGRKTVCCPICGRWSEYEMI